jgi:hypothetical protein
MRERLFSAESREKILAMLAGKPTGVKAVIGELEFELHALTTREGLALLSLLRKFGALYDRTTGKGEGISAGEIAALIGEEGQNIAALLKGYLARCAGVCEEVAEEYELFERWFDAQPLVELVKTLFPKILEANNLGDIVKPRPPQGDAQASSSPQ